MARDNGFVFLTEDELLSVLRTAKAKSIRDWAMILTTYSHGLRAAETCGLRVTDLDMRGGVLSIQRLKGSLFTIQELERHRGIPLLDEVKALKEWLPFAPQIAEMPCLRLRKAAILPVHTSIGYSPDRP
ncbi:MAG: tyrosine-type recombinase/integrase [Acidobacteriia bacterium]|nr:tyrosine-type recombinase/integrase [Terriglobia bacterium]